MDWKRLESLSSHCFQGEFNPVFRNLLGSELDHKEGIGSPRGHRLGQSENLKAELGSIRGRSKPNGVIGLKKMKDKFLGEFNIEKRNVDKKENGENEGHEIGLSHEFSPLRNKSGGLYSNLAGKTEITPSLLIVVRRVRYQNDPLACPYKAQGSIL